VSDTLRPHGLQHARLVCPALSPGVCSNSCPLNQWCNHFILSLPLLLLPSIFPSIRVFSSELALHIRWPKYWSFNFSISHSNEYFGLTSITKAFSKIASSVWVLLQTSVSVLWPTPILVFYYAPVLFSFAYNPSAYNNVQRNNLSASLMVCFPQPG